MKNTVYTHTGDNGTTGLIGGTRIAKSAPQLEAYGSVDELNSYIGLLNTYLTDAHDKAILLGMQHKLFQVGSNLATDFSRVSPAKVRKITAESVKCVETEIDTINGNLPNPKAFIIPGGCRAAAIAHVCRTVCRRAERQICAFQDEMHTVDPQLLEYINRLSDYFFVLSRKVNFENNSDEILWDNTCI